MKQLFLFLILTCFFQTNRAQNNLCFSAVQTTTILPNGAVMSYDKADFNGDGFIDICCNSLYGVSLLLSNGTGNFTTLTTFSLNMQSNAVIASDFNNDGHADIAAVSADSNKVIIILGTGTGTILSITSFSAGIEPNKLVVNDFNNDGNADLAIINYASNNVSIFKGVGNGNFTFMTNYPVGTNPTNIVAADFNNDGKKDIIVTSNNSTKILKGNGTGLFAVTNYTNFAPLYLITEDINSDGKADLIYTDTVSTGLFIMTGNGNYTFNTVVPYLLTPNKYISRGLDAGDFNNDGKLEIVYTSVANSSNIASCDVEILLGQPSGLPIGPTSFSISDNSFYQPNGFIPADIDNDGKLDIIGTVDNDPEFRILYNCNTVGLKENFNEASNYLIYPNPANDKLNIEFSTNQTEFTKAQIINSLGTLVKEIDLSYNETKPFINVADLPTGVYILNLRSNKVGSISKRFVISK